MARQQTTHILVPVEIAEFINRGAAEQRLFSDLVQAMARYQRAAEQRGADDGAADPESLRRRAARKQS